MDIFNIIQCIIFAIILIPIVFFNIKKFIMQYKSRGFIDDGQKQTIIIIAVVVAISAFALYSSVSHQKAKDEAYELGYEEGYQAGFGAAFNSEDDVFFDYDEAYNDGYGDGYEDGYDSGYDHGKADYMN